MVFEIQLTTCWYTVVNICRQSWIKYDYLFIEACILLLLTINVDIEPSEVFVELDCELVLFLISHVWNKCKWTTCCSSVNWISLNPYQIRRILNQCKFISRIQKVRHNSTWLNSLTILLELKLDSIQISIQVIQLNLDRISYFDCTINLILECVHLHTQVIGRV